MGHIQSRQIICIKYTTKDTFLIMEDSFIPVYCKVVNNTHRI